jgi:membrane dipeptidase
VAEPIRVFDGHNDVLARLHEKGLGNDDFLDSAGSGQVDLASASAGGLAGGIFAIFPCSPFAGVEDPFAVEYGRPIEHGEALAETLSMAGRLLQLEQQSRGRVRVVRDGASLDACLADGALAAVMHLEGAEAIGPELGELDALYAAGLRSLGLAWSRPNRFATGVPFEFPGSPDQGPGLSAEGRALVRACDQLGVMVDCSHLNERGFWDVAATSGRPLVASHSNAHALCPSPRNLTDDQLRAIGDSGGVVGINYHVGFVRADGANDADTPLSAIAAHAAHVGDVAGVEAVALGSDFDGGTLPRELRSAADLPALMRSLRKHGFDDRDLERIGIGNWRRVLAAT